MKILSVLAIALFGVTAALLLKKVRPELAAIVAGATGLVLFSMCFSSIRDIFRTIETLTGQYGLETEYIGLAMKIIGLAYLTQLGASICADAGESAVAGKVELCGRILILSAALPVALNTMKAAAKLILSAAS